MIADRLVSYIGLSELISDRAYPMMLPQKPTLPAVVYQLISSRRIGETAKLYQRRYQVTSWAPSYIEARLVADQVSNAVSDVVSEENITDIEVYEPVTDTWGVVLDFRLIEG